MYGRYLGGYQEVSLFPQKTPNIQTGPASNGMADLLQPIAVGPLATATPPQPKRLTTDIDSSLAQTAATLDLSGATATTNLNK